MQTARPSSPRVLRLAGALSAALVLGACATPTAHRVAHGVPVVQAPAHEMYFYPQHGQDARQQDRDRYECYRWAVHRTGSDPGMTPVQRSVEVVEVVEPPPGRDTALGAATGAAIGALASAPHRAGEGAAIGLVLGALIGAMSDQARAQSAPTQVVRHAQGGAHTPRAFGRAMEACMVGRGYVVR